jgi:hypothetical protein
MSISDQISFRLDPSIPQFDNTTIMSCWRKLCQYYCDIYIYLEQGGRQSARGFLLRCSENLQLEIVFSTISGKSEL